jgi:hypothetical protein
VAAADAVDAERALEVRRGVLRDEREQIAGPERERGREARSGPADAAARVIEPPPWLLK